MSSENSEEISINSFVVFLKRFSMYVLKKWIIVLSIVIVGGIVGYFYAKSKKPTYTASLTFVLSAETRSSGFAGLASQLGFGSVNTGGSDLFSGDNIVTLFRSRRMIQSALFKTPPNSKTTLLNILVKDLKLEKVWQKYQRYKSVYPFPSDVSKVTGIQDSIIRDIHGLIIAKYLAVGRPQKGLSYYSLSTTTKNETFSFYFTQYLMDETARFYIDTKTKMAKQNLMMVQREADSLRRLLGRTITSTAATVDETYNLNPALQVQRAPIQKGQVNATFLTNVYNEVASNVVVAKLNLQKEIPLYQIIDPPTLPLKASYSNPKMYLLAGAVLAGFIVVVIMLCVFLYWGYRASKEAPKAFA